MTANYTMTLRDYLAMGNQLFDFPWFIWDESERERIQQMFADYYMFREICVDSPEYFHHLFKSRWQLHWPYFNELYKSAKLQYNPLTTHYTSETESEGIRRDTEETEARLGTSCSENRVTDAKTSHTLVVGTLDETQTGREDEDTQRHLDTWEHTDEHERGTLDSTVDSTENTDETHNKTHTLDHTKDNEGHLEKDVVGNSKRVTDTTSDTVSTSDTTHSDYPQANIAAISPENPGVWVTWTENQKGTSNVVTHGTETIDSTENTKQDTTEHEDFHEDFNEDFKHNVDVVGQVVTDQDTSRTLVKDVHRAEDEHTVRGLSTKDITDQDTTQTTDVKSFDNEIGKARSNTQQANNRSEQEKTTRDKTRTSSGYNDISPQELLKKYREVIINIDKQLVDTFATLFMEVY